MPLVVPSTPVFLSDIFPSGFPTKIFYGFIISHMYYGIYRCIIVIDLIPIFVISDLQNIILSS